MAGLGGSARIAGWLAVALSLGFLGHQLWHSNPAGLAGAHATELALVIGAGTLVYTLASFLLAEAWRHLLGPGPAEAYPRRHHALYGRTQIAKYLPGNCFHFVGRQILGLRLGHPHGVLALASLAEAVSLLLAAGVLALPLAWSRVERALGSPSGWLVLGISGVVIVAVCLNRRRIRAWHGRAMPSPGGPIRGWALRLLQAGLLHVAFFAVAGLILWGLATAIQRPGTPALGPAVAISTLAMAWWVGFLVPGSSAGLGIREAVLVLTLEPYLARDGALLLALALRLTTTFGDLLFFLICAVGRWEAPPIQSRATQPGS